MVLGASHLSAAALLVKSRTDPQRLLTPLRQAAKSGDPRVTADTRLLANEYEAKLRGPRLASTIAALVAGLVLTLACLGIFGVVSYGVALRTKEIGIRVALGAQQSALIRAIVRQVLTPVGAGAVIGLLLAIPAGIALHREPFYLESADPLAFALGLGAFALAGGIAALWPAVRVLRRNPVDALRQP